MTNSQLPAAAALALLWKQGIVTSVKTWMDDGRRVEVGAVQTRRSGRRAPSKWEGIACGDAQDAAVLRLAIDGGQADLVFTDPPYNVPIDGHVCGFGRTRHREFAMGGGELSGEDFTGFLRQTLGNAAAVCRDGAIAFVCMDWRHLGELIAAGEAVFSELKNLCVWNKTNGGMGTFYRSKHS